MLQLLRSGDLVVLQLLGPVVVSGGELLFMSSCVQPSPGHLQALADRLCGGRLVLLLEGGYDLRVRMLQRICPFQLANPWLRL